jgi:peroxiredoxin
MWHLSRHGRSVFLSLTSTPRRAAFLLSSFIMTETHSASRIVPPGTAAPEFELHSTPDQTVRLSDFLGRPVVLAFYPADWSPICGDQMAIYNEMHREFHEYGAQLLGISVDGVWCHRAFSEARHLHFPLLADFEPKGSVSRLYGAYREGDGFSERALVVIDARGVVRWSYLSPVGVNPGADGIFSALDALTPEQRGQAAAAGAEKGGGS